MNPSSSLRARLFCFVAAQAFLMPCVAPVWAQEKTANATTSPSTQTRPAPPLRISLELRDTTLRNALISLLFKAKVQDSILDVDADVPNTPITISIRDQTLDNALRILLQKASSGTQKLTYSQAAGAYHIKIAPAQTQPAAPALFSLDLKATPLRQALTSLLTNAHAQYSIGEDVPDTPVTLTLRDKTVYDALQLLLRQVNNSAGAQRVTYTVEAGVIQVKTAPAFMEPLRTDQIALLNVRPSDVMGRLQTAFPTSLILPGTDTSYLLVRGSAQQNQDVRELASLLDTAPKTVVIQAEVVLVTDGPSTKVGVAVKPGETSGGRRSRTTILSTSLKTLSGQETTGEEKTMGTPTQSAKLQLNATPFFLGDGTFQVDTRWDVSLPLLLEKITATKGKGTGLVRLEKRLTTTTRLKNHENALVGGVLLSQYGLKGSILFYITLFVPENGTPAQGTPNK